MLVVKESTGDKVRRLREDLSLSQRELAAEAGISPATVLKIEQDTVERPHPRTLRKLAEALEVSPRDLRAD
jgi:transcriptional regulator with XRE-family HTH domain